MAEHFGKYDAYSTSGSIYCYAGTNVLRNRFGIRDAEILRKIEADITTVRQHDLLRIQSKDILPPITFVRFIGTCLVTSTPFAGHFRRESIAKGQTIFEHPSDIERKLKKLLSDLKSEQYLNGLRGDVFISRLAYYFAELNYLHPFREGNGRATREFIRQLLLQNGYEVNWAMVSIDTLLRAMEHSVFDTAELIQVLKLCITVSAV